MLETCVPAAFCEVLHFFFMPCCSLHKAAAPQLIAEAENYFTVLGTSAGVYKCPVDPALLLGALQASNQ